MRSIKPLNLHDGRISRLLFALALPMAIGLASALGLVSVCGANAAGADATGPAIEATGKSMQEDAVTTVTLKIGTNVPYFPFEYYSGTQLTGFDIELMDALALEANFTVEYITVEWEVIFGTLINGDVDALISGLTVTPNREEVVDFTLPYLVYEEPGMAAQAIAIAVPQGNSELRHQMNAALWQFLKDGTIENLINKYFDAVPGLMPPEWPTLSPITETTFVYTDSLDSPTIIQVPAGAVTEPIVLEYTPVDSSMVPSGFSLVGQVFELAAYREGQYLTGGISFAAPATVTLFYSDSQIVGLDEDLLLLERWDESAQKWTDAACGGYNRHPEDNWLAVPICHASRFALVEEGYIVYLPILLKQ